MQYRLSSTASDNTIRGHEPRLSLDLEQKIRDGDFSRFGFTYLGQNYDDSNIANLPKISPLTITPAIFLSQLTSTLTLLDDDAYDVDGDYNFTLSAISGSGNTAVTIQPTQLSIKILDGNNSNLLDSESTKGKTFCDLATSTTNPSPYKIEISSDLRLTTAYGDPNGKDYTQSTAETLKQPAKQYLFTFDPSICYAKAYIQSQFSTGEYAGPASEWHETKGFLPQSSGKNFPTTGADKLYFDLSIIGVDTTLNWQSTLSSSNTGDILVTFTDITPSSVRVTLRGPAATDKQKESTKPGKIAVPQLPAKILLEGKEKDGSNKVIVKYAFEIQQWFVGRGNQSGGFATQNTWCTNIGYTMPKLKDFTNASGTADGMAGTQTIPPVDNPSGWNHFQRRIDGGFFSEWSNLNGYETGHWGSSTSPTWTADKIAGTQYYFMSYSQHGRVWSANDASRRGGCVNKNRE